jgi:hypothetical protein
MVVPRLQRCQLTVCTIGEDGERYRTDPDCETKKDVMADMERHKEDHRMDTEASRVEYERDNERAQIEHEAARLAVQQQGGAGGVRGEAEAERSRSAKLDRPPMEHRASEGEWTNF